MKKLLIRKNNRLRDYDYSKNGYYFVAIGSKNRKNIFGNECRTNNVGTGLAPVRIDLSKMGEIIERQWRDIANRYDNVELDKYVIMPNHIHGRASCR